MKPKTMDEMLKSNRQNMYIAMVIAAIAVAAHYTITHSPGGSAAFGVGFVVTNLIVWHVRNFLTKREREQWERRMLNTFRMVNEAAKYHESESGTIMSAYHHLVYQVEAEGFSKNYILKSQL